MGSGKSIGKSIGKNTLRSVANLVLTLLFLGVSTPGNSQDGNALWADVVAKAAPQVVSLQLSFVRDFVEVNQGVTSATGFIVDAERGIILTNRHVVGSGPVNITATFQNLERVDAVPLYRDPVHDFGFMRYNPEDLKRNSPSSLPLNPRGAKVGTDIRVIGSDGGEQLSILAGTIARVDRRSPNYGRYGHNDFNTFYLQAASSTSGGSSGSPVLNQKGEVIALNAAANSSTASSFFLPLDRIAYALEKLQAGEPVARGTVQTVFEQRPYRLLSRLGLDAETTRDMQTRFPASNGMLLVRQVLPGGVAVDVLEEGDILLAVNSEPLSDFVKLAELLDSSVGSELAFEIVRRGTRLTVTLPVQDLEALQPSRLLEIGDSVLHNVSIQRARGMNLPQSGVVVAKSGYEFSRGGVPRGALITQINGRAIESVDDVLALVDAQSDVQKWRLRFTMPGSEYTSSIGLVDINSKWFAARSCDRRDDARFWDCEEITLPASAPVAKPLQRVVLPGYRDNRIQSVAPSLVRLSYDIPYAVDNVYAKSFSGVGLIVDAEKGLVVTDRNTVPVDIGDLEVTFFSAYKVPGKVVYLHPLHNIALLQYDPALLGDVEIDTPTLATEFPAIEEPLEMIGYRNDGTIRKQMATNANEVTLYFNTPQLSRFQQIPVDVLNVTLGGPTLGGVLLDDEGTVQALWQSFAYQDGDDTSQGEWAMPAALVNDTLQQYLSGKPYYIAPAMFEYDSLDVARERGLTDEWIAKIAAAGAVHRRVMTVSQSVGQGDSSGTLVVGDVLLEVDGAIPANFRDLEARFQKETVSVTVLRDGVIQNIDIQTIEHITNGTHRVLLWAGSLIQEPHFELAYQRGNYTPGVFISGTLAGSPSIQDRLYRNRFITEIDGVAISSLDDFVREISSKEPTESVNLTVIAMNGYRSVVSVQPEYNFWPTVEVSYDNNKWQRRTLSPDQVAVAE